MTLWADADSLPREVKDLIGRRAGSSTAEFPIRAIFVANRSIPLPPGKNLQAVIVGPAGASAKPSRLASPAGTETTLKTATESADEYILASAKPGDILVTRDIPLATRAVELGILAINDRGALWTRDEVRERLSLRDHMEALRASGLAPASQRSRTFGPKEVKAFADALDKAIRAAFVARAR
ncbi:MAG: DUF188 domain-containing protein [Spirochaetales bacterium]|nr:DUF188 domain-containing protein [Spirochaetales bacterium]